MKNFNKQEAAVLVGLQRGIPLISRPFAELGAQHGVSESAVLELVRRLLADGDARRFGAVFDSRRLGYRSALCAMTVPQTDIERIAAAVALLPGVTHAYERGWPAELSREGPGGPGTSQWPNFWFTLSAPGSRFSAELNSLRTTCTPFEIYELPATRRFKIDVVFDLRTRERDERVEPRHPAEQEELHVKEPGESQRAIIKLMQGHIEPREDFFAPLARELELDEEALLAQLREWHKAGVLRRLGLLLRHREIGFKANGMCCWEVPESELLEAGRRVAAFPEVTHCYARPWMEVFPFRLYAMIHTHKWSATQELFERISRTAGLPGGQLLLSLREFKKTSMSFF